MKYPVFLPEGGRIGFPAPSFGCSIEPYRSAFDHAQEVLRSLGHGTIPGPNAYLGEGIGISNTPEKCGEELTKMYLSDETDALISCGGGELMCEILDYVDFAAIRQAPPKWYMGYSDNTNMVFLLATLCDTAAIYGPCAPTFGMEPWHQAVRDAYDLLRGKKLDNKGYPLFELESLKDEDHPLIPYNLTEQKKIRAFSGMKECKPVAADAKSKKDTLHDQKDLVFEGRLIGGCLDCLVNLAGTCYDKVKEFNERYADDGIIWFMESCDLNVMSIRRAVWELDHAGWFSHVKGFLIGRPCCYGQELMGLDQYHAVVDLLGKYNVPILMDLDIGHLPPMMPLIVGSMTKVSYETRTEDFHLQMSLL